MLVSSLAMFSVMLSSILTGCSAYSESVVTPPDLNYAESETVNSRMLWGVYSWVYDEGTREIEAVPLRWIEAHWDVTAYLKPPECNDCLKIKIAGFNDNPMDMWVVVTLKNPTEATAKDVRGIFLDENQEIRLMDPTALTPTWDWHYPKWHNAFKPFMIKDSERKFGPGQSDRVLYRFRLPDVPDFSGVRYIVDGCWPKHCPEPYEFEYVTKSGPIGPDIDDSIFLAVKLFDWQLDPAGVTVDISPFGFPGSVWMDYVPGQWYYQLINQYGSPEGKYVLRFTAYDQKVSNVISYDLDVWVSEDLYGPNWSGPMVGLDEVYAGNQSALLEYGTAMDLYSPDIKYIVYMDNTGPYNFEDAKIFTDIGKSPTWIYGLENGKTHTFMVRAMDGSGNMEWNTNSDGCIPEG